MRINWLPFKFLINRATRIISFVDPIQMFLRFKDFAQPASFKTPLELLRVGMTMHARGVINANAVQHNLDWIWPFWVVRQYDPLDRAFIPRAFTISHVNLTHRNWTAIGLPDYDSYCIVDPRGLLTPRWGGWSLDAWLVPEEGPALFPSRAARVDQRVLLDPALAVETQCRDNGLSLVTTARVEAQAPPVCEWRVSARSQRPGWLVVALRPFNPEGVGFINTITVDHATGAWQVDKQDRILFTPGADRCHFSDYANGDVSALLSGPAPAAGVTCRVGMATAAALYRLDGENERTVCVRVPLKPVMNGAGGGGLPSWPEATRDLARLSIPDGPMQALYDIAVHTLILHTPGEVFPGPFTYKHFWFRDAAYILSALLCIGAASRVERILDTYPARQTLGGFFFSQEGEWDSNGEALWTLQRFCELTGRPPKAAWRRSIVKGARWISHKRSRRDSGSLHAGLMPAGLSAEHLGPPDYYLWDNFWSVAGLEAAAQLLTPLKDEDQARHFKTAAQRQLAAIERSLAEVARRRRSAAMPASPYRRMDSAAIGSLVAGYPLKLFAPNDPRLLETAEYLVTRCLVRGALFHDIIHSGINPYLTLHLAQVLMRAGDDRWQNLVRAVAGLASATGQWPEAIHPITGGGCMGDGQHVWAAAEWVLMLRNGFVREEGAKLILCSGLLPEWLDKGAHLSFGPAPTTFGPLHVTVAVGPGEIEVAWRGQWRGRPPVVEVALPGFQIVCPSGGAESIRISRISGS